MLRVGIHKNFLGTLNLYADRTVRVGDFCRNGEDPSPGWLRIGTIEEIGLRFTSFGESSLNVEILAYVNTLDWNEFLAIQ
jgi:small-conductance mechanosensitive channel